MPRTCSRPRFFDRRWARPGRFDFFLLLILILAAPAARADLLGHGGPVRSIDISPDGSQILTGSFDYTARLWDFVEQRQLLELNEHLGPVNAVLFLPDGKRAVTGSDDRTAILWDLATGTPIRRFSGHDHKVMALAVSPDGKTLATGSWDGTVRLWEIETGRAVRAFRTLTPVDSIAFAADGMVVTGGHDAALQIWDGETGKPIKTLQGHNFAITKLAVSADGWRVLSTSIDNKMKLWDLRARRELREYAHHDGQVLGVALARDGKTAVTVGRDGRLIQWNLATGQVLRDLPVHEKITWDVALSPDGRFAVTASSDETVRIWHLQTGDRIGPVADQAYDDEPKPWLASAHPGARLFRKCAICHALESGARQRSGPHFENLFNRAVGSVAGYKYSDALKSAGFSWTDETLFELFNRGPDKMLPGTKMPVQKIKDAQGLRHLIDYIKELTGAANR